MEILVLEHGQIVERGNFRSLVTANGRFAEMWRLQQEEGRKADAQNASPAVSAA